MKSNEPLPLWMEAIPDREPWRRGRVAIACIAAFVVAGMALALLSALLAGDISAFFACAIIGAIACLLLYLIWIGQNWARWIVAPIFAVFGFACLVWTIVRGAGDFFYAGRLFLMGLLSLTIFSYLGLSPAVYAFARRQREHASALEAIVIGAGFLLILASIGAASLAFHNYKRGLEQEATEFAQLTFHRVFENHDASFLDAHASSSRKMSRPAEFIHYAEDQLGRVLSVGPFGGTFTARFDGERIALRGKLQTRAVFQGGGFWVRLEVSGYEGHWSLEHLGWEY